MSLNCSPEQLRKVYQVTHHSQLADKVYGSLNNTICFGYLAELTCRGGSDGKGEYAQFIR